VERGSHQTGVPALRFRVPTALQEIRARYEIPFGSIERPHDNGQEVPAIGWASLSGTVDGKETGLVLVNDYQHGHALEGNALRLHLIRSSCDPDPLPEIGDHEIQLRLGPTLGQAGPSEATRRAAAQHHPLLPTGTDVHKGSLPASTEGLRINGAGIEVSCLKQAESGEGMILRLYEVNGRSTEACVTVDKALLGAVVAARETDVLERPLAESPARVRVEDGQRVFATVPASGIVTLCIVTDTPRRMD
jgi:alpha-mannosidase